MKGRERHEIMVRVADQVERMAVILIQSEVPFRIEPQPDGWWRVRAWYSTEAPAVPFSGEWKPLAGVAQAALVAGTPR